MVKHGIDVWWEHRLILVVHLYRRVSPPQECLWHICAVIQHAMNLQIRTARAQRKPCHTLLMEHFLHLTHPHRDRAILVLLYGTVCRHICCRTVMLRPVKLYTAANPRTQQSHQCRLYHMVIVNEVALPYLVVCHLYPATQLGQHHHLYIFILQPYRVPLMRYRTVGYRLYHWIRIYHAT